MKDEQTCCKTNGEPGLTIERIETYPLFHRLSEPYGDANGYKTYRSCFLIRLITRDGIEGWGECVDWLPTLELGFRERIQPFLLGKNALDRQALTHSVAKWHTRAAAAVSMALTEIIAKFANLSVCQLWGGRVHQQVTVYASFQSYTERPDWQRHSLQRIEQAIADGFSTVKIKVGGKPFPEDRQHVEQVAALAQGQIGIALDGNQSYDFASSKLWRDTLDKQHVRWAWLEEPMPLALVDEYRYLRSMLAIPVAGGENLASTQAFLPLLGGKALDIVQPDPLHLPGLEAYRQALDLARTYGIRCSPHTFDGALTRWYAILAQAVLPPWSKMAGEELEPVEWDVMENPFTQLLSVHPKDGIISLPEGSGIGCSIDLERLQALRWDGGMYM